VSKLWDWMSCLCEEEVMHWLLMWLRRMKAEMFSETGTNGTCRLTGRQSVLMFTI
jgi:hypothetical protein